MVLARVIGWITSTIANPMHTIETAASWVWSQIPLVIRESLPAKTLTTTIDLCRKHRVMGIAAEVSFWAVLSLTPLLLVTASMLGWADAILGFDVADSVRVELSHFVRRLLGTSDHAVGAIDELFSNPDPRRFTLGLATSVYSASRGFTSLIGGLDHVLDRDRRRNWLSTRIIGVIASVAFMQVLLALLVLVNVGQTGFGLPGVLGTIVSWLFWPLVVGVLIALTLWLLHSSPKEKTPLTHDLFGAVVTVAIWFLGSWLTTRYLSAGGGFSDVLGLLGGSVGMLLWVYAMMVGIFVGAEANVALLNTLRARKARLGNTG